MRYLKSLFYYISFHQMTPEELEYYYKLYLTCDTSRKDDIAFKLISADREQLLKILTLPEDSEERFRIYDLIIKILPDGQDLLNHVFEECRDESDPLNQLVAIQFVNDNKLNDINTFLNIFKNNVDNPLTLPSISQTIVPMIMASPDPTQYQEYVEIMIQKAVSTIPDVLGALPPLTKNDFFAQMMLNNDEFKLWLIDLPYKPELRTFNIYMRNLLASHIKDPSAILLSDTNLINAMTHPSACLRCAAFDHIAMMAPYFKDQLLAINRFKERLFDVSMDTTLDERRSRDRATNALGLTAPAPNGNAVPTTQAHEDIGPDIMVI
ncbi:hypothetical protein TRFO_23626 [Tritrichomonas foetus]|uniref:Uncharacterized protein n=1 Tax=Tritrichomonas foetus TaxID=1144522 RepID=A0A1J4KAU3_9EUKA|nr:hypothetical protein TRFO_23626 [Tritrichomonas foetus]|eukprot:OHT08008.1 hypothetical protein TRFO_23626 [Tritrichomonas foetus]